MEVVSSDMSSSLSWSRWRSSLSVVPRTLFAPIREASVVQLNCGHNVF